MQRQRRAGQPARAGVAQVGAVHGQRAHAGADGERGPGGEAEVGVDDVEAPSPVAPRREAAAQVEAARASARPPGGNSYSSTSTPSRLAQRGDLVAHEAPALGVGGVGLHVRDHERAHDPPT